LGEVPSEGGHCPSRSCHSGPVASAVMLCSSCHAPSSGLLCPRCVAGLRPAPERVLEGGIRLVAAFEHVGPARELVHGLKYRGQAGYADLVVSALVERVPPLPVVPVPRAWTRQMFYGVDPAREIATRLARALDVPLWDLLHPPIHSRRRAGGDHSLPAGRFSSGGPAPGPYVLVDDVVTTGATVRSAANSLGSDRLALVVAANAADRCLVR
jgi:predicted amidophosphoribosyltransferase